MLVEQRRCQEAEGILWDRQASLCLLSRHWYPCYYYSFEEIIRLRIQLPSTLVHQMLKQCQVDRT